MYGVRAIEPELVDGIPLLRTPPKPQYDSTNDKEFCCWAILGGLTSNDKPPSKTWDNLRLMRSDAVLPVDNTDQYNIQYFDTPQYPLDYIYSNTGLYVYILGFVACYYQDFTPKWTFKFPNELRQKIANNEDFENIEYSLTFVEQRVNKGAPYYFDDLLAIPGEPPTISYNLYSDIIPDLPPTYALDKGLVVDLNTAVDLSKANVTQVGQYWSNWNTEVPLTYCPTCLQSTQIIDSITQMEFTLMDNTAILATDIAVTSQIPLPINTLESVSIISSFTYNHDYTNKLRISNTRLIINGNSYDTGLHFSTSRDLSSAEYLIITNLFGYDNDYPTIPDVDEPNFGVPIN